MNMNNLTITVSEKTKERIERLREWVGIKRGTCVKLLIYDQYEKYLDRNSKEDFEKRLLKKRDGISKKKTPIPISFSKEYTNGLYAMEKELNEEYTDRLYVKGKELFENDSLKFKKHTILRYIIIMGLDGIFSKEKNINKQAKEVLALTLGEKAGLKRLSDIYSETTNLEQNSIDIAKKINISRSDAKRWILAKGIISYTDCKLKNE